MNLDDLYKTILDRKTTKQEGSYVSSLFEEGLDRIVQKVGEESVEVVIAAKNNDKQSTVSEVADLWFHTLVMLAALNITPEEISNELEKRKK